jgi:sarcosine oxidase
MPAPDVIVAGLGAMGSATVMALARRGVRVLGLDARRPPHDRGSSHGESRVIRAAYFEHPLYVPLARDAFARWRELESRSGRRLLLETGVLAVGAPSSEIVTGTLRSAREHGVAHESLQRAEVTRRWPAIVPAEDAVGVLEPGGGVVLPEACIETFLAEAAAAGADLRFDQPMTGFRDGASAVEVTTGRGVHSAGRLLVAAGAWIPALLTGLPLRVERQSLHWFAPPDARPFAVGSLPVFLFEEHDAPLWYGVPDLGSGLKAGVHHHGADTTADTVDRAIHPGDVDAVRRLVRRRLPTADVPPSRSIVCLYTNTPDSHFLIDQLPGAPRVLVASACSGHGFKFASALGEVLADRLTGAAPAFDLEPFRLDRPALRGAAAT